MSGGMLSTSSLQGIIVPSTSCPTFVNKMISTLKRIKLEVVHSIFKFKKQLLKIKTTFNLKLHVHTCIIKKGTLFIIYGKMSQTPNQGYQKFIA
jgi:hypothetical protein